MKSIVQLLALSVMATFALSGCNQNTQSNSTDAQSTNTSVNDARSMPDVSTNIPAAHSLPDMNTNMPASTNQ